MLYLVWKIFILYLRHIINGGNWLLLITGDKYMIHLFHMGIHLLGNGILTITVPKETNEPKKKNIEIK